MRCIEGEEFPCTGSLLAVMKGSAIIFLGTSSLKDASEYSKKLSGSFFDGRIETKFQLNQVSKFCLLGISLTVGQQKVAKTIIIVSFSKTASCKKKGKSYSSRSQQKFHAL